MIKIKDFSVSEDVTRFCFCLHKCNLFAVTVRLDNGIITRQIQF